MSYYSIWRVKDLYDLNIKELHYTLLESGLTYDQAIQTAQEHIQDIQEQRAPKTDN